MSVGIHLLRAGLVRRALRYLVVPVNYWRSVEYELVCRAADFRAGDRVLDVGSPKLLALYLAERLGARVVATDIDGYFLDEYALLRRLRGLSTGALALGVEDGRDLSFDEGSFDRVYAVSVLEHIPGDGDSRCIREMARVLAPGGRCILTVPFWPTSRVDWRDPDFYWSRVSATGSDGRVFYQRRYSEADLHERLVRPSGLRLDGLRFVGEVVMVRSGGEFCDYLRPITGPVQPLLSRLLHTGPVDDWRELEKPLCALIVLGKPEQPNDAQEVRT